MKRDFTATVFVIEGDRVLLMWHRKWGRWMPAGGHLEENETPWEGAIREAHEETGLEVSLLSDEHYVADFRSAHGAPRPYVVQLEELPASPYWEAHQHVDFIYAGTPVGGVLKENERESNGLRWFTLEEVAALRTDKETLPEIPHLVEKILEDVRSGRLVVFGEKDYNLSA